MNFKSLIQLITSDLNRYKATGTKSTFKIIFLYQAFWATCFYRIFSFLYLKTNHNSIFRFLIAIFYNLGFKFIQIITGISIPAGTIIGAGLHLAHFGPILVSGGSVLGDHCNLGNSVVIGFGISNDKPGSPRLGNRVFVGPGAKILGPVNIGNDAAIGANAVVTHDVPERAVVGGVPARIINFKGSFRYIKYSNQDKDPDRIRSLEQALKENQSFFNPDKLTHDIKPRK